jgi:rhodanese-related sulfurtransferase
MVATARRKVESVSVGAIEAELAAGAVLVDVREEDELRVEGWIAESVWAPRGMLEFWADPASPHHRFEFQRERRIVLYCAWGSRSALAADTLRRMGYRRVAHLDGGLRAWKEAGQPLMRP